MMTHDERATLAAKTASVVERQRRTDTDGRRREPVTEAERLADALERARRAGDDHSAAIYAEALERHRANPSADQGPRPVPEAPDAHVVAIRAAEQAEDWATAAALKVDQLHELHRQLPANPRSNTP